LGPTGLTYSANTDPSPDFFADIGKLLLMFFSGLEIDLTLFRQARRKAITFGLMTTSIPLALGTSVALLFGYEMVTAIVVGSLLASHTLLAAPFVMSIGANVVAHLAAGGCNPGSHACRV
jgi:Kef-type K+ transport system membrane component KefB